MTSPLCLVDDEQCPYIAGLVVHADEALHARLIFGDEENCLIHVPGNLRVGDERGVGQTVLSRSMPHLVDTRQVGASCQAQAQFGHDGDDFSC